MRTRRLGWGWRPACVALFPAVAIGAGLAWGAGIRAGLGGLVGHAAGGMSRSDLQDLGETVYNGQCAVDKVGRRRPGRERP